MDGGLIGRIIINSEIEGSIKLESFDFRLLLVEVVEQVDHVSVVDVLN